MKIFGSKRKKKLPVLRIVVIAAAGAVFLYAAYQMFLILSERLTAERGRDELADMAVTALDEASADGGQSGGETDPRQTVPLSIDFDILQSENPDIIAWIYSEGTPINYPVVQGKDNQYYLKRLTDLTYNSSGTLFMDFRNSSDFSDRNSVIYGHNMKNKSMFGSLVEYKQQDYYDEHPYLWLLTKERAYRIDLIAGFVTASDSDSYCVFETKAELDAYISRAVGRSTFSSDADTGNTDRIVTLSTCSYENNTARYVVIGKLVPIEYEN